MSSIFPPTTANTIFVVDDNPVNLKVLFTLLKQSGFKVLVATHGEDALEKLQHITPDLILLDISMPRLNGFEICTRFKENPNIQDIPVIFLTALNDLDYKLKGLALGAVDFISKPFQKQEVLSRICLHLKLSQLQKTLKHQNQRLRTEVAARETAEAELVELNHKLEKRVEDRTQALSQAIQQLESQTNKLHYQANHDLLTALPNRACFMEFLREILKTNHETWAILWLDLDDFKKINDSFGHIVGDRLLQKVANRLCSSLSNRSLIARLGGDEFAILLPYDPEIENLDAIAQNLLDRLKQPFILQHYILTVNASIGIISSIALYRESTHLLKDADCALYYAKTQNKGKYAILTPYLKAQFIERTELEADLYWGIQREEFCLHYQPIFSLTTQKLLGFEALIRWQHPSKGLIPPDKFIPLAEETGIVQKIDLWAIQVACNQIREWNTLFKIDPSLSVSVNYSSVKLQFLEELQNINWPEILQDLSPQNLKIEITERGFWEAGQAGTAILEILANCGIELCIDDFGTGYSSLSRLHDFPAQFIKIDRSFVQRLVPNSKGLAIAKTILNLTHDLNMKAIAEGIETQEQLEILQSLNCDFGQGYFLSKPLDVATATQLLSTYFPANQKLNYA
ncbi:MAG: EAL domain-containing protein [Spirulinaceae cyanobacterium]